MVTNKNICLNILSVFLIILVTLVGIIKTPIKSYSEETVSGNDLIKGYATSYTAKSDAKTCTGNVVREGICGGYKPYIGKTIILYQRLPGDHIGEIIGIYECLDTGTGTKSFQQGKVIDVFKPSLEECQEFMDLVYEDDCKGHVWIQVIDDSNG